MKRKTLIVSLVLMLSLVFSSVQGVFAATEASGAPTKTTKAATAKVRSDVMNGDEADEVKIETVAKGLSDQVAEGKYKLISTAEMAKLNATGKAIVIDTMPAGWWSQRHIPGALNLEVGVTAPKYEITAAQKTALLKMVKSKAGTKKVKYYWNSKKKKWVTKKPAKKYYKKCTKKGDKHKGKKKYTAKVVNKDATIVVYCGFTKCQRSHQAAMFLSQQGFKNVYRYAGGIVAWVDGGNNISGSDLTAE